MITLLAFAAPAGCAIVATLGRFYSVTTPDTMRQMLTTHWHTNEADARNLVARRDVDTIASLRDGNNKKSGWLRRALIAQVVALLSLTAAVGLILNVAT